MLCSGILSDENTDAQMSSFHIEVGGERLELPRDMLGVTQIEKESEVERLEMEDSGNWGHLGDCSCSRYVSSKSDY